MTETLLKYELMNFMNFVSVSAGGNYVFFAKGKKMKKINFHPLKTASKFISSFNNYFGKDFITFLSILLLIINKYMNLMNMYAKYALNRFFYPLVIKK